VTSRARDGQESAHFIYREDYSGFVYDLTTINHHFAAGCGELIVHNTDSVFSASIYRKCKAGPAIQVSTFGDSEL
jgi:hypothetical protein